MKKLTKILLILIFLIPSINAYPSSTRGHLITMGKSLVETIGAPIYGIFVQGPKNIKQAYTYEAWEREKKEKRGLLRYKMLGIWRAPGEEAKGIIKSLVNCTKNGGKFLTELISIFFSD